MFLQATMAYATASMLSPNGRCKTLDSSADGYVRAESVVAMAVVALETGSILSIEAEAIIKVRLDFIHK